MNATEWAVLVGGVGAIAWVNWYFFFAARKAVAATSDGGTQQIEITVRGGYDPGVVED